MVSFCFKKYSINCFSWKYAPIDVTKIELDSPCLHLAEGATLAEISRRHLPLELSERKRFQQYRLGFYLDFFSLFVLIISLVSSLGIFSLIVVFFRDFVASKSAGGAGSLTAETTVSKLSAVGPSKLSGTGGVTAGSLETASSACSRAQTPTAPSSLEDERHSSVNDILTPEYDRPSVAAPYTPRHFPLSSPVCQDSP